MLKDILDNFTNSTATYATSDAERRIGVARIARVQVATDEKKEIPLSEDLISNWWLIHFVDLEPLQVAIWPPCNHADALALNPQAVAAEPINSTINDEVILVRTNHDQ